MYGVDTFTAVNLLAFSRWAGQIKPTIPFSVTRWIYAVCIIISFALLIYRWTNAIRAIRSKSIARSYLNSLAMRVHSMRPGGGWKRFLVFAELTKSKKGAEYAALFTYFSFESWMNTVFADGPRQVVNAITLYSVMQMDLLPGGENAEKSSDSSAAQFFENIKILAVNNNLRAVVLMGMLFTLVIWVLSVIKLLVAITLYLVFLFHHIPARDGTLTAYCRRKINNRVMRIVSQKVNKALAKGVALQDRDPLQPGLGLKAKPTLPNFGDEDKEPMVATLSRTTTQATLPLYTSRPGTTTPDQNPRLPNLAWSEGKPTLNRTATDSSANSESMATAYSPLDRQSSPAPPVPPVPTLPNITAVRSNTNPLSRPTNGPRYAPKPSGTVRSAPGTGYRGVTEPSSGVPYPSYSPAPPEPLGRSMTTGDAATSQPGMSYPNRMFSPAVPATTPQPPAPGVRYPPVNQSVPPRTFSPMNPVPPRMMSPGPRYGTPQPTNAGNYVAFDPTAQTPTRTASPAYRPYAGPDAASPLNDYRRVRSPGPVHITQGTYNPVTNQPLQPYRNDGHF